MKYMSICEIFQKKKVNAERASKGLQFVKGRISPVNVNRFFYDWQEKRGSKNTISQA